MKQGRRNLAKGSHFSKTYSILGGMFNADAFVQNAPAMPM
jgi:hypothetical protein